MNSLRRVRKVTEVSQGALADELGISQPHLLRLGQFPTSKIKPAVQHRAAEVLGIDEKMIFTDVGNDAD